MTSHPDAAEPARNQILRLLPPDARAALVAQMTPVVHQLEDVLFDPGEAIDAVHFPLDSVVSLVTVFKDGSIVEIATVGNEGLVGVPLVRGGSSAVRCAVQVPGRSLRMPADAFLRESEQAGPFNNHVRRYCQALFGQVAQAAACYRLHANEERLSRWLLMSQDRVGSEEFVVTHRFLGRMLGRSSGSVTLSAGLLQAAGLIRYRRGRVTILDRPGLEAMACECYWVINERLGLAAGHPPPPLAALDLGRARPVS